ncbi:hypothetical protein BHM03_00055939 [Ensete ventricosum]|nr:hypothetical protein BHM03_00055939 [Ensete ventricosum]
MAGHKYRIRNCDFNRDKQKVPRSGARTEGNLITVVESADSSGQRREKETKYHASRGKTGPAREDENGCRQCGT